MESIFAPLSSIRQGAGNLLSLSLSGTAYQWYKDGQPVPGATGAEFTATESGQYYATIVTDNGCISTTDTVTLVISATSKTNALLPLGIYPNPVNDKFYVQGIENEFIYSVLDFTGKTLIRDVTSEKYISVSSLAAGIFVIRIEQDGKVYQARFAVVK